MPTFTGTSAADVITPTFLSPGVVHDAPFPGPGADTLSGGDGDDTLNGGTGGDSVSGGTGADLIVYAPGAAASDHAAVDGGLGTDTLRVDASGVAGSGWSLSFAALANGHADVAGSRAGQTFDVDNVNVETVQLTGSSLADHFVVGDHGTSKVTQVSVDLGADTAADDVTLNTTAGKDNIVAQMVSGDLVLTFNNQKLQVHDLGAGDRVSINAGDGDDNLDLARVGAAGPSLTVDAGAGNDTLRGANAVLFGGAGDDSFIWSRDGNDTMDGGAGQDTQTLTTSAAADQISLAGANGHILEQVAGARLDVTGVELINLFPQGGADAIRLGDLSGTDLRGMNIDLSGANGAPDGAADSVLFTGSSNYARVDITDLTDGVTLDVGLTQKNGAIVMALIKGFDAVDTVTFQGTSDWDEFVDTNTTQRLLFDVGDGNDVVQINASSHVTVLGGAGDDGIDLTGSFDIADGGAGRDAIDAQGDHLTVTGGQGDDSLFLLASDSLADGGDGADTVAAENTSGAYTLSGGAGDDQLEFFTVLQSTSGAVTIDGGVGFDTLVTSPDDGPFSSLDPVIDVLNASGTGASLQVSTRFSNTVLDVRNVESIRMQGGDGADQFVVGDMTGSTVAQVVVDLGFDLDTLQPDRSIDKAVVAATAGNDVLRLSDLSGGASSLTIGGLAASVVITDIGASPFPGDANDNVFVSAGAGNDLIDLTNMNFDHGLEVFGGPGNDTVTAGFGAVTVNFDTGLQGFDVFNGFRVGSGGHTRVDVSELGETNLSTLKLHHLIFQQGADVVITDGAGSFLTLTNVSLSTLTNGDFIF